MTHEERLAAVGFHSGELAVQRRAGVGARAARLAPMASRGRLGDGTAAFLASARLVALTARDPEGRLWISPLQGEPGFLRAATPTRLHIDVELPDMDPLAGAPTDQPVGVLVIDLAARRRYRINGQLMQRDSAGLAIDVDQAYGNCPKYIDPSAQATADPRRPDRTRVYTGTALRPEDRELIERSTAFFLGTTHPTSGNDASHRGGPAGFVRADAGRLWWPDYPGNNMFNSFGNLTVDPSAALLFVDAGTTLQLSGRAEVVWDAEQSDANLRTGRRVIFAAQRVIATRR
ncbi:pyridoxamine 5'-phosphate oxidase family protein [Mycolicibacterium rhodesiae]|uniref:Pyridoxamine 5'-phosphate oxidase n=1 Tax=Mycolicibacterium rhodesiae TaxID=36814 RepID=A0A1X0IXT5_MYCRH|nr:pyridoxamine 5'-phosphate oxidase family protein [Mycolicibacterium rhodesiae]MCV7346766.1 pyridoxamine 5'-phosphate oxidase family protein [Mycolicibacterium rhodesiae]ORB53970.1 pyridoxamine 5'-phosphate oxidase [Mycolicibacterium rhodesiae]